MASAAAPRYARPFAVAFLALIVVCAFVPLNLWPFSNWELFSRLRTDKETAWEAVAINRSGSERDYPIAAVPRTDRGAICSVWLHRPGTRIVRIYHVEWLLSDRDENRTAPRHRTLAWICSAKGARAES